MTPIAPMHQAISERQNSTQSMELLRAFTWFYLRAKRWHAYKVIGMLLFALASPLVLFWIPSMSQWIGALAGAWVLVGRTLLTWLNEEDVNKAAKIQEQFDVELFDLHWNASAAGSKEAHEDILNAAEKIHSERKLNRLRNWYPNVDSAIWPLNVLACQRSNIVWSRRANNRYSRLVLFLGIGWLIIGLIMAIIAKATTAEYLLIVFLPSQPAFLDTVDLVRGYRKLSVEQKSVENHISDLWELSMKTQGALVEEDCRVVQDQIYRLRRIGLQIPQIVYLVGRKRDEKAMRTAAARLLNSN